MVSALELQFSEDYQHLESFSFSRYKMVKFVDLICQQVSVTVRDSGSPALDASPAKAFLHPPPLTYRPLADEFRLILPSVSVEQTDQSSEKGSAKSELVRGTPGIDYPTLYTVPNLNFRCDGPGYFADPSTRCQVMSTY